MRFLQHSFYAIVDVVLEDMAEELGIAKHTPTCHFEHEWEYASLANAPPQPPEQNKWATSIHRGLVPAKNIDRRDFAIAGALVSTVSSVKALMFTQYRFSSLLISPMSAK